jgi:hypothetical protein
MCIWLVWGGRFCDTILAAMGGEHAAFHNDLLASCYILVTISYHQRLSRPCFEMHFLIFSPPSRIKRTDGMGSGNCTTEAPPT